MHDIVDRNCVNNVHMYGIEVKYFDVVCVQWCTCKIDIEMEPRRIPCNYMAIQEFIINMPNAQSIESMCNNVHNYISDNYQPYSVTVKCKCEDAKFMPVEVTRRSEQLWEI